MAPHFSTLAWKIPWTREPGRLQSMGSRTVGHDWATWLSLFTFMHWRRKWQPTPVFLPGESPGQGSLVGCRLWVAQSRTRLKWLSSSSSSSKRVPAYPWQELTSLVPFYSFGINQVLIYHLSHFCSSFMTNGHFNPLIVTVEDNDLVFFLSFHSLSRVSVLPRLQILEM